MDYDIAAAPRTGSSLQEPSVGESHGGRFTPHPMRLATVLYRSVSLPELEDIYRRGAIVGGRNRFNPFDPRPDVFFSDVLDAWLISQGEDTYRQAVYHAQCHPAASRYNEEDERIRQCAEHILGQMDGCGIPYDLDDADALKWGEVAPRLKRKALRPEGTRKSFSLLFRQLLRMTSVQEAAGVEHGNVIMGLMAKYEAARRDQPITSVVLVTRPIAGGLFYSDDCCLWPGPREFGFEPGQIKLGDIAEIILIKAGTEVGRCDPQGARVRQAIPHFLMTQTDGRFA